MTPSRKPRSIAATPEGIQKLKDARKEKGLTNQTISDETYKKYGNAGISEASVNNFITKKKPVQPESVIKIIEVLGLKPEDIVALEEWQIVTGEVKRHKNSKNKPINWHEICQKQATQRQKITTNSLTFKDGINHSREQLYVPLGLVERKKRERRTDELFPEKGSQMYAPETYEVTQTYAQKRFFEEVIQQGKSNCQGKRLAVIGEPGAGKTTLLQELEQWVLDRTDLIPVWVSLASLGEKTLEDYLLNNWLKEVLELIQVTPEDMEALKQLFEEKKVWLLLDGADEMSGRSQNVLKDIASQINGWLASAKVILTCRLNVWDGEKNALDAFDTYRTLEFSYPEQVHLFIENWFDPPQPPFLRGENGENGENGESLAVELKRQLEEPNQSRIRDLIKNPLRLALLCRTWQRRRGNLPETQAELYGRFVEDLYIWKRDEFPTTSQQRKRLNQGLGELALRAIEGEKSRFRLTHGFVCQVLGEPDTELHHLALELGWLNRVGVAAENPDEPVYAFYHPTFEEYFAALTVENWDYFLPKDHVNFPVEGKKYRIFESQWKQVILLWLGREDVGDDRKEEFIQKLVEFEDGCGEWNFEKVDRGFYEYQAYFLAAAAINEFKACSLASEIVRQVVKWGFGYFNIEKQEWQTFLNPIEEGARETIPETIRQMAISELINILEHCPDENTRREMAECLWKIDPGNPEAIAALVKVIANTEDEWTRNEAVESLEKIGQGNLKAIAGLVNVIATTESDFTRRQAIESLGEIDPGNPEAIAGLVNVIDTTEDEWTRRRAIESLGKIGQGNPEAIAGLVNVIDTTEDEWTRRRAIESLGKIGQGNPEAIAALVNVIATTEDEWTRRRAIESLGEIDPGNPEAIAGLVNVIATTEDEWTRRRAIESLGKIGQGNPEAIAALVNVIATTEDEWTRGQATGSLWEIGQGNPVAIAGLVKVIATTKNESIRRWLAVVSLGKILATSQQYAGVVSALKDCLSDEIYQNNFDRFYETYKVIWNCAENLPYPQFYQAWHHPVQMTHPEVEDNTPVGENATVKSLENLVTDLCIQLQNRPIYCLDAEILETETDTGEIAQTLCELIWKQALPNQQYPEVSNAAQLRRHLNQLQLKLNQPQALLLTNCEHPTPELTAFCHKLTNTIAIAFLTDEPLKTPLKGFPPNQPNLLSAIITWLEEI
ncbi:HEAT repeats family protein [Lyngbya aestuarii BL J]|uniref:HEAT repeats family protein n=1 Tax=Lyngbya aestuarii BL J TaxID=1348334 RepID=U7QCS6_9CYAN|nr:HEAT repeat domain-containing protein [Lyngbya aestuarii]ERT05638.1 HEAT repeats family protein [Lyngbya aestuarii BL J]